MCVERTRGHTTDGDAKDPSDEVCDLAGGLAFVRDLSFRDLMSRSGRYCAPPKLNATPAAYRRLFWFRFVDGPVGLVTLTAWKRVR